MNRLIILVFAALVGVQAITIDNDKYFEILKNIEIFTNVYKELNTNYVDDIDPNQLMRTGIDAMVGSLDPFTNFISESQVESYRISSEGRYEGVGAIIREVDGKVTVIEPYENSAADKAGLKAGDVIVSINGNDASGKSSEEVIEFMRGTPGTTVKLGVLRYGSGAIAPITLERNEVNIPNVPYFGEVEEDIAYIKLTTFTANAGRNVRKALSDLKKANPNLSGVILDLRGNGGGLLMEAVNLCNIFIPAGLEVVSTKGKVKERNQSFATKMAPEDVHIPVVVLINNRSASASEIVSGVLQDYDRAVLMGQRSYGKGLVQNTKETGYHSRVKLTTSKYYIPSGRCIQSVEYEHGEPKSIPDEKRAKFKTRNGRVVLDGGGVKPDIVIDLPKEPTFLEFIDSEQLIFKYVNDFIFRTNPSYDSTGIQYNEYDDFKLWFGKQDLEYVTDLEEDWYEFLDLANKEGKLESFKANTSHISSQIALEKENDLEEFKAELINRIEVEIAGRYFYQSGKAKQTLAHDHEISEAVKLLRSPEKIKLILHQ